MIIRLLTPEEKYDASLISTYCFHGRVEDPEKQRQESTNDPSDDWGAFSEDGALMAHVINNAFTVYLNGEKKKAGGIGAVSTLAEYRRSGAIRAIMQKLLPSAYENGEIVKKEGLVITTQCIRVPVLDGHTAAVFVKFKKKPTKEELIQKLVNFAGEPQKLALPSAPKQFIQYLEEDNRPQVKLDVDYEGGMGVSVGRLREDTVYDWKFVGLAHNTLRGAAGGAVLCAELLKAKDFIKEK